MSRQVFWLVCALVIGAAGMSQAATYDNVYWVGGDGEWTGDVGPNDFVTPVYNTGHWSASPGGPGLPAKYVLGRNDGIRVGQVTGASGGFDVNSVPCKLGDCSTGALGGTQLGTDIYITSGAHVTYNSNRQLLAGYTTNARFGDFRFSPDANFPGTPTLNMSNGSSLDLKTSTGGDADGNWTRWNGAELNLDNATLRSFGDPGFTGGALMLASYHGYANSSQTVHITNGGKIVSNGQLWFGVSDNSLAGGNQPGIRIAMTINNGSLDLSGGDNYLLDNDGLPLRADLAFVYSHTPDGDANPADDEMYTINFTGPGSIKVQGDVASSLDGDTTTGGGGIRVARQNGLLLGGDPSKPIYIGGDTQASYQDLWNLGILRANNKSGLTGDTFGSFFSVSGTPGGANYTLTSLLPASAPTLVGDFNADGKVDAADYVVWRDTNGSTTDLRADADQSLKVDIVDFLRWKDHFGETAGSGLGAGAVPEPTSLVLMLMGLSTLGFRRRAA